jgi:hypothetical protein
LPRWRYRGKHTEAIHQNRRLPPVAQGGVAHCASRQAAGDNGRITGMWIYDLCSGHDATVDQTTDKMRGTASAWRPWLPDLRMVTLRVQWRAIAGMQSVPR